MREKRKLFQTVWDIPYGRTNSYNLFDAAKNSRELVQKLQLQKKIPVHDGCVNSICWNENGRYLLSGSDDQRLSVVHGYDYSVLAYVPTGHRANIFSAKFLPNTGDSNVVSCSGDGIIIYSDLKRPETSMRNKFNCHRGTAYQVITVLNDPNTFLSCGEDRSVRWFDVRTKTSCSKEDCKDDVLITCQSPVTALAVNPLMPYQLALGCADASVRIFDRRMLCCTHNGTGFSSGNGLQALMSCFTVPEFTQSRRITSLSYSSDGLEVLVSYSSDYVYLFDIRDDLDKKPKQFSVSGSTNRKEKHLQSSGRPLMKRLRIRGDWSDTGPNARPEGEEPAPVPAPRNSMVRTMTDILTRMFNSEGSEITRRIARRQTNTNDTESSSTSSHASEIRDGNVDPIAEEQEDISVEERRASEDPESPKRKEKVSLSQNSPAAKSQCSDGIDFSQPSTSSASVNENSSTSSSSTMSEPNMSFNAENINLGDNPLDSIEPVKESLGDTTQNSDFSSNNEQGNESKKKKSAESEPVDSPAFPESFESASTNIVIEQCPIPDCNLSESSPKQENSEPSPSTSQQCTVPDLITNSQISETQDNTTPNPEPLPPISNILPVTISRSSSIQDQGELSSSGEGEDRRDLEFMMEVDSEGTDSDDESRPILRSLSGNIGNRSSSCDRFLETLDDEVGIANEDLKKMEDQMSAVFQPRVKKKFTGHRNARTMIKESSFWGDNFIMSGSDCGHIFIWDRYTAELVMLMEADHHVVNCLQPHPFDPILASSGIDYDIKLWAPSREEPYFDSDKADEILRRNEIMLEETKDTITVPASFMFRMFTTLNSYRTGRANRWSRAAREMRAANAGADRR